jgi:hypothetical protein
MKKFILITASLLNTVFLLAQSVGIGTNAPTKKLSVNGSIVVDHGNQNNGSADSAALLFGTQPSLSGILSNKNPASNRYGGLDFFTNGFIRFSVNQNGNMGIGTTNPGYTLHVLGTSFTSGHSYITEAVRIGNPPFFASHSFQVNGTSYFNGTGTFTNTLTVDGTITGNGSIFGQSIRSYGAIRADTRLAVGGITDEDYRLRIYDGNARIGGDFHATGNSAVGGLPDQNFRFRVYDGNSRFGGDVQVTGDINVGAGAVEANSILTNSAAAQVVNAGTINASNVSISNSLTIDGKGSVRSNGPSALRIGFDQRAVDVIINNNSTAIVVANITDFSGNSGDVRVMVSHISLDVTSTIFWPEVIITVVGVDAAANTCSIALTNKSGNNGVLRGTIYLTSIAKD